MTAQRLDAEAIRRAAKGRWLSILSSLGIDKALLTNRGSACPICKDGTDRFRFDDKEGRGTYYCNSCGSGDGFSLLQKANSWTFIECLREVAAVAGGATTMKVRTGRQEADVRCEMNAIWRAAKPLAEVQATAEWWHRRAGYVPQVLDVRGAHRLACAGHGEHPAMVAMIRDAAGKPASLHRTYLTPDGEKAAVPSPRRVMDIPLPDGAAVRLFEAGEVLGVAEGIETAVACQLIFELPTWALLTAGNMRKFVPPETVRRVVIFGDLDSSFTGQAAAFDLARALWAKRKQWNPELRVEVSIHGLSIDPAAWDCDWNDVLQRRNQARDAA